MSRFARVAAAVVGLIAPGSALAIVDPAVVVSGPSPFVRGCGDVPDRDLAFAHAEVEPFVAVNPTRPANAIAVWQQDRRPDGGARGLAVGATEDGGRTWTRSVPPAFSRCAGGTPANGGGYRSASDPWVTFGPDGRAYFMALAVDEPDAADAMLVATSTDGGVTWSAPSVLASNIGETFNDKNSITADPTRPGTAYAVWSEDGIGSKRTLFTRTTDGGQTWEQVREIAHEGPGFLPVGHQIAVRPDGSLVMVYTRQTRAGSTYMVTRSADAGLTWSPPRGIARLSDFAGAIIEPVRLSVATRRVEPVRTGDGVVPDVGVDPRSGAVYVVWNSTRALFLSDVFLTRSDDGGLTWSPPRVVSANRRTQAFTPSVEVAGDGTVAITYYDFSADSPRTRPLRTSAWVARSTDGGVTFGRREPLVARPFDLKSAPLLPRGRFLGDYQGLAASGTSFLAVFAVATRIPGDRTQIVASVVR